MAKTAKAFRNLWKGQVMKFASLILMVAFVLLVVSPVSAFNVVPGFSGNNQFLKGWVGFGDPNGGLIGPYGKWNDEDSSNLWGVGARGQIDVSNTARNLLGDAFGIPEKWWDALDSVGARVYVANEIGACNLAGEREADTSVLIGARLLVLHGELGYKLVEGGGVDSPDGWIDKSGFTWFIGIGRTFTF